jgi:hypothetical protein
LFIGQLGLVGGGGFIGGGFLFLQGSLSVVFNIGDVVQNSQ